MTRGIRSCIPATLARAIPHPSGKKAREFPLIITCNANAKPHAGLMCWKWCIMCWAASQRPAGLSRVLSRVSCMSSSLSTFPTTANIRYGTTLQSSDCRADCLPGVTGECQIRVPGQADGHRVCGQVHGGGQAPPHRWLAACGHAGVPLPPVRPRLVGAALAAADPDAAQLSVVCAFVACWESEPQQTGGGCVMVNHPPLMSGCSYVHQATARACIELPCCWLVMSCFWSWRWSPI